LPSAARLPLTQTSREASAPFPRNNRAAFSFVVNLIIPGTPILSLVSVFINEHHPTILGRRPEPGASDCDWQPFDFALHRCVQGGRADAMAVDTG
jgi:hypothetical protein